MTNKQNDFILKLSKIEVTRELVDLLFGEHTTQEDVEIEISEYPTNEFCVVFKTKRARYEIDENTIMYWYCGSLEAVNNVFKIASYIDNYIQTQ